MSERFCTDLGDTCLIGSGLIFFALLVMVGTTCHIGLDTLSTMQTIEFYTKVIFGVCMTITFLVAGIRLKK